MKHALLKTVLAAKTRMSPEDAALVTNLVAHLGVQNDSPDLAGQWHMLAEIARMLSLFQEARSFQEQAASLDPDNPAYLFELARDCHLSGDLPQAIERYSTLLEKKPDHAEAEKSLCIALLTLSETLENSGELAKANFWVL